MIFLIAHTIGYSQDSILQAELDYALIPASNQRVSAQQVEAALKVPLDFGTVQLQPTIGLRNYDFEFWESMTFNTHPVDNVNNFFAGVDAPHSLDDQWQLDAICHSYSMSKLGHMRRPSVVGVASWAPVRG